LRNFKRFITKVEIWNSMRATSGEIFSIAVLHTINLEETTVPSIVPAVIAHNVIMEASREIAGRWLKTIMARVITSLGFAYDGTKLYVVNFV